MAKKTPPKTTADETEDLRRMEFARMFDHSPMPLAALSGKTHRVTYVNPAFCELSGKKPKELEGKTFPEAVKTRKACLSAIDRVYRNGETEAYTESESFMPRKNRWTYSIWAMAGTGQQPDGVMVQMTETEKSPTAAKEITAMNEQLLLGAVRQHELTESEVMLNALLQKEIAERTESQAVLQETLEPLRDAHRANSAKTVFLASMSHELRTPLTAIIGYLELIEEDVNEGSYDCLPDDLVKVRASSNHLLTLISNILDTVKIEAGKMNLDVNPFDAKEMIDSIALQGEALAVRNGNQFEVHVGEGVGAIDSDENKVRQVLLNLLGNAAKFTHDGTIILTVEREDSGGDFILFHVSDTGIGISPEESKSIFNSFYQVRQPNDMKSEPGTGLGLSLCRQFCDLLRGSIDVKSELGKGTEFTVKFPVVYDKDKSAENTPVPPI